MTATSVDEDMNRVAARWVNENVEEKGEGGVTLSEVALDLDAMAIKVKANLVIEERERVLRKCQEVLQLWGSRRGQPVEVYLLHKDDKFPFNLLFSILKCPTLSHSHTLTPSG
ncbi:unnamed protein product [Leuciscus chuanchicus]